MREILTSVVSFCLIAMGLLSCGADDNRPGEKAEIPASDRAITFDGGKEGPVVFQHEHHSAEHFGGVCIFCHNCEDVSGATHWSCRDCHSAGKDLEEYCEEADIYHGCIMTQCQNCHTLQGSPAPDGLSCGSLTGGCHM